LFINFDNPNSLKKFVYNNRKRTQFIFKMALHSATARAEQIFTRKL